MKTAPTSKQNIKTVRRNLVNRLYTENLLEELYQAGLINYKVIRYRDIYYHYDMLRRTRNFGSLMAKDSTAFKFHCTSRTVARAISYMGGKE